MTFTVPRVPHLPGSRLGHEDLRVADADLATFLDAPSVVVEKTDGVAVTFSEDAGALNVGMKADWRGALGGAVLRSARRWLLVHADRVAPLVTGGRLLHAEWVHYRLVLPYARLPAAVIVHGWTDRAGRLLPRDVVNAAAREQGLGVMEPLFRGVLGRARLHTKNFGGLLPKRSALGAPRAEGLIVEVDTPQGVRWAKWVAPHYRQPVGSEISGALNGVRNDAP